MMGLFQKAVETYDYLETHISEKTEILTPIGFKVQKVQIKITLDMKGNFKNAEKIDNNIIIPVTIKSDVRTGKDAYKYPHPLSDKLSYLSPDFWQDEKPDKKDEREHAKIAADGYNAYVSELEKWDNSDYSVPQIKIILEYIKSKTIREDLKKCNIKYKTEDVVCWSVNSIEPDSDNLWQNQSLITAYSNYYKQSLKAVQGEQKLCYILGEKLPPLDNHPKSIVSGKNFSSNAKLISSNDDKNFTYLGRFENKSEALTISAIASQKAHCVIKWLVANQGVPFGSKTIICWCPHGDSTSNFAMLGENNLNSDDSDFIEFRRNIKNAIMGYQNRFDSNAEIVMAILGSATRNTGRLSVCYYNELQASDFFDRLDYWNTTCSWFYRENRDISPSLKQMVSAAYGTIRNGKKQVIETDDVILTKAIQQLLLCKLERTLFPSNLVRAAVQRCSTLQLYDDSKFLGISNREKQLFVTCSMIKKYRFDHFKEEWTMALEPEKKNRSYQYGRLLAVMEKAERDTYEQGEKREPNAIRMQPVFVKRPKYAEKLIIEQLKNAYYPKLSVGAKVYYDRLIGEIMLMISECSDGESTRPLSEEYLMGYYLQKNELYRKKNDENNNDMEDNEQ